jgi:hypothetical protein
MKTLSLAGWKGLWEVIDRNSVVVNLTNPADIPVSKFKAVLADSGSPAFIEAGACYQAIISEGVSVAFALACFQHESHYATDPNSIVVKLETKNPGNTRSSTIGSMPLVNTDRGVFVKFDNWQTGFRDLAHRLVKPDYVYAQEGRRTIEQIITRFAPASDGNNPAGYIDSVISAMNKWIGGTSMPVQIDDRSGQLADGKSAGRGSYVIDELILHETSGPHDVRNAAPDLARTLDDATISWFLTPRSDVSIHYLIGGENLGAPVYRLCPENRAAYHIVGTKGSVDGFSIDNHQSIGIERMGQPNDNPGPNQARALCELALDICRRNARITPDRIFSHAQLQPDRRDGNTLLDIVRNYVRANLEEKPTQPPGPDFTSTFISFQDPVTGKIVLGDFARYYLSHGGIEFFGRPISGMIGGDARFPGVQFYQWFERARFEWHPKEGKIMLGLVGREAMSNPAA